MQEVEQQATAEYWFERGQAAETNIQWAEAAYAYRQCVERDAGHWRSGLRLAAALGQLGQAEATARALVEASDVSVADWYALVAELAEPTWYQLRECLEAARSTAQDGFTLLFGLALVFRALKQGEQARQTLEVIRFMYEQQVTGSAKWFKVSGNLHLALGLNAEAIADYNQAIKLKPDYAFAYLDRGFAKRDLQDYTGALADFNRAIELRSDDALAYYNRANIKRALQDYAGAEVDYDRAIELEPDFGCLP